MKTVLLTGPFKTEIVDTPAPELPQGGLLLTNKACGICGSDIRAWGQGSHGRGGIGHEVVGVISEVSRQAQSAGWKPGMRVIPVPVACGHCRYCLSGNDQMCPNRTHAGFEGPGGFSDILPVPSVTVQSHGLLCVPDSLDDIEAVLCEPLACVLNGQEKLSIGPGKSVCVIGAGPIGVSHALLAHKRGASRVFLLDIKSRRLALAQWVGADEYIDSSLSSPVEEIMRLTEGQGVDFVIVCCSSPEVQADAVQMAARLGCVLYFSGLPGDAAMVPINIQAVHRREITLIGSRNAARRHFALALDMLAKDGWRRLVTHTIPLDITQQGFEIIRSGDGMKVVIQIEV